MTTYDENLAMSEKYRIRPRVGLTGSFGRGNYGDELYVKTYQHWFGTWADLLLMSNLPRPAYFRKLSNAYVDLADAIVLGGGDLLCPYRPKIDRDFINIEYLRRQLHVCGIGVERNKPDIDPDVVNKWKKFLTHPNVRSISTRDLGSAEWIAEHIGVEKMPHHHTDLACALPLPAISKNEGPPILGIVTRHIKHPKEYHQVAEIAKNLMAKGWRVRHIIGGVGAHGLKDFENAKALEAPGKEVVYSEKLDDISRALGECTLLISMKLHTTIVGTMYGVPTISANPVVKAKEFLKSVGREQYAIDSNDPKLYAAVEAGVPRLDESMIKPVRDSAIAALSSLSNRIWSEFRSQSAFRVENMAEKPKIPAK